MVKLELDAHLYYLADARASWGNLDLDGIAHEGECPGLVLITNVSETFTSRCTASTATATGAATVGWCSTATGAGR